jgi:transposase
MFALTSSMSYYLCPHHVDIRKGMIKILHWQKDEFILYIKKLEKGTFEVPLFNPGSGQYEMKWATFVLIMEGIRLQSACYRQRFAAKSNT